MLTILFFYGLVACSTMLAADAPDAQTIISNSVAANNKDFKAADDFTFDERDVVAGGTKTYSVTMIEGSPYQRLIAINKEPLRGKQEAEEQSKFNRVVAQRKQESARQRRIRIAKHQADQRRNMTMLNQLSVAFSFELTGTSEMNGFPVYELKATPKPGYRPPNMDSQVLPGMEGLLWVDQKTFHWVKVVATVIRPVSIEGFLAQVEPGTEFEIEKGPVDGDIWQITHYAMRARAKVLFMFNHNSQGDETYSNFRRIGSAATQQASPRR